jgi:hypothetical protein
MAAVEAMQTCNQKEGPVMQSFENLRDEAIAEHTGRATIEIDVVPPEMFGFHQCSHRPRKDRHRKHETASQAGDRPAKPDHGNGITATQGLWLKMVSHVVQLRVVENERPSVLPENDPELEPTPIISNSKSSKSSKEIPFNVEVPKKKRTIVLERMMSEITLNPSQHPAPARPHDIVILPRSDHSKMVSRRGKIPSHRPLPSILGDLYPDYTGDDTYLQLDDITGERCTHQNDENGPIKGSPTLSPTSLRHALPCMDEIPPLPFADDDHEINASETRDSFLFQLSRKQQVSGIKQSSPSTLPKATPIKSSQRHRKTFYMPSFKAFSVRRLWCSKVGDGTVVCSA